jgi:hypothetical protein
MVARKQMHVEILGYFQQFAFGIDDRAHSKWVVAAGKGRLGMRVCMSRFTMCFPLLTRRLSWLPPLLRPLLRSAPSTGTNSIIHIDTANNPCLSNSNASLPKAFK